MRCSSIARGKPIRSRKRSASLYYNAYDSTNYRFNVSQQDPQMTNAVEGMQSLMQKLSDPNLTDAQREPTHEEDRTGAAADAGRHAEDGQSCLRPTTGSQAQAIWLRVDSTDAGGRRGQRHHALWAGPSEHRSALPVTSNCWAVSLNTTLTPRRYAVSMRMFTAVLALVCCAVSAVAERQPKVIENVTVWEEPGRFGGWPANHGIWSWGNEILVGFSAAYFKGGDLNHHLVDKDRPGV